VGKLKPSRPSICCAWRGAATRIAGFLADAQQTHHVSATIDVHSDDWAAEYRSDCVDIALACGESATMFMTNIPRLESTRRASSRNPRLRNRWGDTLPIKCIDEQYIGSLIRLRHGGNQKPSRRRRRRAAENHRWDLKNAVAGRLLPINFDNVRPRKADGEAKIGPGSHRRGRS